MPEAPDAPAPLPAEVPEPPPVVEVHTPTLEDRVAALEGELEARDVDLTARVKKLEDDAAQLRASTADDIEALRHDYTEHATIAADARTDIRRRLDALEAQLGRPVSPKATPTPATTPAEARAPEPPAAAPTPARKPRWRPGRNP